MSESWRGELDEMIARMAKAEREELFPRRRLTPEERRVLKAAIEELDRRLDSLEASVQAEKLVKK